jgi:hypothetical protein
LKKKPKFAGIFVEKSMEGSSVTVVDWIWIRINVACYLTQSWLEKSIITQKNWREKPTALWEEKLRVDRPNGD